MKKLTTLFIFFICCFGTYSQAEISLPEMGDSAGALISPVEEYQIGQSFYWRLQQSVDLIEDPEINHYLDNLGYRLVSHSDEPARHFTFFMVPASSVNAFAAPGGFIGVHSGLFLAAESEDEVASVLAHEIAHVTQRHILRSFEKQQRMTLPMTAAMIGAALLGIADPQAGTAALMAVQAGNVQMQINHTRSHEAEADSMGMQTLVRSGFDPQAMPSFFEKLQQASRFYGEGVPEFLRTHPVTLSRIADARGRAMQYKKRHQLMDEKQFYLMREKLRVLMAEKMTDLLSLYQKQIDESQNVSDVVRYGYAQALLKSAQFAKARSQVMQLIEIDPERLSYQLLLADIDMAIGQVKAAMRIYDDFQKLYPDDRALSLKQVQALLQIHQPLLATRILEKQLSLTGPNREVYKLLSKAKGDMGQKSQAHSALAEYYYLSGQLMSAKDQLELAADFAGQDEYQRAKIASRLRQIESDLALMEQR